MKNELPIKKSGCAMLLITAVFPVLPSTATKLTLFTDILFPFTGKNPQTRYYVLPNTKSDQYLCETIEKNEY
ncbi:hypothetical protein [Niabella beijingensis]|uniref:hypothetical protein n=1 Tax=Niabella beijingensis TaxID=2872700 RepID=UPI001CBEA56A|nr:hypothetical protein [Niabella beijingensis]MBZ4189478.1 hypothetical protein [Niabella beijingensis]